MGKTFALQGPTFNGKSKETETEPPSGPKRQKSVCIVHMFQLRVSKTQAIQTRMGKDKDKKKKKKEEASFVLAYLSACYPNNLLA